MKIQNTMTTKTTMKLKDYMQDGANWPAKAVLACLQWRTIGDSWNAKSCQYTAEPDVARWENGREQGYVASLRVKEDQLNIAWFEHRNTGQICAVKWEQNSMKGLTIDNAKFGKIYTDKWDVSHEVGCGEAVKMANWIWQQFEEFYAAHKQPAKDKEKATA